LENVNKKVEKESVTTRVLISLGGFFLLYAKVWDFAPFLELLSLEFLCAFPEWFP